MISIFVDIWPCVALAALLGVGAGWLAWGRHTTEIVSSYRGRVAKLRGNWEAVEERLSQSLARAAALERERDALQREWAENHAALVDKEETWKQERRLLEETVRQLNQRLMALEANVRTPPRAARAKRNLGQ